MGMQVLDKSFSYKMNACAGLDLISAYYEIIHPHTSLKKSQTVETIGPLHSINWLDLKSQELVISEFKIFTHGKIYFIVVINK